MTISKIRSYNEEHDFCIYIDSFGMFTYQDMCGYKTYKTVKGLERMLRRYGYLADGDSIVVE